jgi:hypothetical protein
MKSILSFFLLLFFTFNNSQGQSKEMNSVMGIPFGSTKAQVKAAMSQKQPGIKIREEKSNIVIYNDGKFGGRSAFSFLFKFTDSDKLHTAIVLLDPVYCSQVHELYDGIVSDINGKYYVSDLSIERYKYPYDKSDRENTNVITGGYATIHTIWTFDMANTPDNTDDDNGIMIEITNNCIVKVSYQDGVLIDEVVNKQKEKNSKDY